jgi:hypothetical protein
MIFKKKHSIKNVLAFKVHNHKILFIDELRNLFLENIKIADDVDGFDFMEKYIIYYNSIEQKTHVSTFQKERITSVLGWIDIPSFNGTDVIIYRSVRDQQTLHLYQFQNQVFGALQDIPGIHGIGQNRRVHNILYYISYADAYTTERRTFINALSLVSGKNIWERELNTKNAVSLHMVHSDLFIAIDDFPALLIAVDTQTGSFFWQKPIPNLAINAQLSKKGNTILSIRCNGLWVNGSQLEKGNNVLVEAELETGKIRRHHVLIDLDHLELQIKEVAVHGDFIYFTAQYQGSFGPVAIGVLHYETLQLLRWQIVKMNDAHGFGNFLIGQPIISDHKLYILDKTSVLHIFELELNVNTFETEKAPF